MKRYILMFTAMALIYSQTILLTACPSESQITKAANKSNQLSSIIAKTIAATATAYDEQAITLETKDRLVPILRGMNDAGITFNQAVIASLADYKATGAQPNWHQLNVLLNEGVIASFADLLKNAKLIPGKTAKALIAAIAGLRAVLLILSETVGGSVSQSQFPKTDLLGVKYDYG